MRVDEGTTYWLPALSCACCSHGDEMNKGNKNKHRQGITLNLQGLPMIHDNGVQTGVGARGWYNSAVLSAMLILGHEELHQDLQLSKNTAVLELGAGAIGLVGMTMAWILSQQQHSSSSSSESKSKSTIFLTDNDPECLEQLERNSESVLRSLQEYHHPMHGGAQGEESNISMSLLPEITTKFLDWEQHSLSQAVLVEHPIDLVVGAELAYTMNNALALQVAKILELNPNAVVWIVQFPRNGWFQVFQMQLKQKNPNIRIKKISPEQVHDQVHALAQSIMPTPIMGGDLDDIKALRITLAEKEGKDEEEENDVNEISPSLESSFDLTERIRQAQRSSEQLSEEQQDALNSHWDIDDG
jgi:hypothetical protein